MTGRTCGIVAVLSAVAGAVLATNLREPAAPPAHGEAASADLLSPRALGTVASVHLSDEERSHQLNRRLHFCVFENGENDLIYVGTNYGLWYEGEFDLSIDDKVVFTGKVANILYAGVVINMGDVLTEQPRSNIGIHITRVTGWFK